MANVPLPAVPDYATRHELCSHNLRTAGNNARLLRIAKLVLLIARLIVSSEPGLAGVTAMLLVAMATSRGKEL